MSEKIVVVALGHRALGTTLPEQKVATKAAAKAIADLVERGCQGGNLPQQWPTDWHDPHCNE